jgi:acyl-CoA synthetase (AMP-forming)/AMP-acid ligase II
MRQEFNSGLAFLETARNQPDAVAIRDEQSEYSFGHVARAVVLAALHMRRHGSGHGRTVVVRSDDMLALLATVFGSSLLGCRWTFAGGQTTRPTRHESELFFDSDPSFETRSSGAIPIDESWARVPEGETSGTPAFEGYASPDDIWMISTTSGTTGTPKSVGLSHRTIALRNAANRAWFDRPGRKVVGLFPPGAPALMSRYISALIHGGQIVASVEPDQWLKHNVDLVFGSPSQVRTILNDAVLPRKLPLIHLSGSSAPEKLIRHLLGSFDVVANGYGSTEAHNCLSVFHTLDADGSLKMRTQVRDVKIQIVDHEDNPVPEGREGIVRVSGPCVAKGYLENPESSAAAFRNGCFYPGDIGMWTSDGQFVVTGRINDMFNLGGVKLNAALLDYTLQNVPGIEDAICFIVPDRDEAEMLRAMVSLEPGTEPDQVLANARIALMRIGGLDAVPRKFLISDTLPRNPNGKPDRAACAVAVEVRRETRRQQRAAEKN